MFQYGGGTTERKNKHVSIPNAGFAQQNMQVKLPYVGNTSAGCAMLKYVRIVNLLDVIQVFNLFQDGYMELASMLVWFLGLISPLPSTGGPGFVERADDHGQFSNTWCF